MVDTGGWLEKSETAAVYCGLRMQIWQPCRQRLKEAGILMHSTLETKLCFLVVPEVRRSRCHVGFADPPLGWGRACAARHYPVSSSSPRTKIRFPQNRDIPGFQYGDMMFTHTHTNLIVTRIVHVNRLTFYLPSSCVREFYCSPFEPVAAGISRTQSEKSKRWKKKHKRGLRTPSDT